MYPLKKYFTEGLIQLTIMLSLLRMDPDTYLMGGPGQQQQQQQHHLHDLLLVQGSAHTRPGWDATPGFLGPGLGLGGPGPALHPKNPDAAVLDGFWDMRRLLDEVRSLDRIRAGTTDIAAWLVHSNGGASGSSASAAGVEADAGGGGGGGGVGVGDVEVVGQGQPGGGVVVVETRTTGQEEARALEERPLAAGAEAMPVGGSELTKEDLDLIEVLWRQDVDLGAERVAFDSLHRQRQAKEERLPGAGGGVDGTHAEAVDGETGEVVEGATSDERLVQPATLPSETFSLDECLQLLEANFPFGEGSEQVAVPPQQQQLPPRVDLALPTMTVAGLADRVAPPRSTALERHLQELLSLPEFEALAATNDSFPDAYDSALLPELAGDAGRGSLLLSSLNASSCPITRDVSLHDAAATAGVAARDETALLAAATRRDASSRAANPVARGPFSSPPPSPSSSFFFSSGFEALDPCHSRNFFRLDSSDGADVMDMELGAPLLAPLAPRLSSDLSDEVLTGLLDPAFLDELSLMDLTDEEGMDIVGPAAPPAAGSCSSFSSASPSSSSSSSAFSSSSSPTGGVVAIPTPPRSDSLLSACDGISSFFGVSTMSREQSGTDAGQQQLQLQQQQSEAGEMIGATPRTSLCAELDSDSGLSLGSSPRASSPGSSITAGDEEEEDEEEEEEEEGAVGYSDGETMDVDSSSDDDEDDDDEEEEEGAVGGYQPEYRKFCRMDFRNPDSFRATPSLDHVQHNHTYNLQAGVTPAQHKHQQQQQGKLSSAPLPASASSKDRPSTRLSRDERRARAMKIPFSTEKIINLPVEDFNALLGGHRLSEPQLALVRDIRRRGKNKVAAQNCRKRKLDTLLTLEGELAALRRRKDELLREKLESGRALRGLRLKLGELHAEVLASLRDGRGAGRRPLRPAELLLLQRVSEAGVAGAAGDDGGGAEAAGATAVASRDRATSGQRRAGSGKKGKKQEKKE